MFSKLTLGAGAALVGLAALGGVAWAQSAGTPSAPAAHAAKPHHGKRNPFARIEHGEATVAARGGDRVVDVQRGQVTAVGPTSVSVRSKDGFTASYAVDQGTKVRKARKDSDIGQVKPGDQVGVVAWKNGATATAKHINDRS